MSPQVVIDDSDSQIQYSGQGWFADQGSQDKVGNYGPTYKTTSHGTKENGDSFSFSFSGTSITVWGTTALTKINNGATWDPSWECFVDNVSIGATKPFQYPENNWDLCGSSFSDGQHTLTLKVSTSGTTFWFDYITYVPSPSVSLQTSVVMVQNTDPNIIFGSGWAPLAGNANSTSVVGSQIKYNFIGTGLAWYGFIPTELPHNEAQASYSIDGGSSTTFNLNGLPANSVTVYNQAFFTTPSLSAGSHSIIITYKGGAGAATPLTLDYILLNNVSIPSSAGTTGGGGTTALGGNGGGTTSNGGGATATVLKPGTSVGATVSGATTGGASVAGATAGGASVAGATAGGSTTGPSSTSTTGSLDTNPSASDTNHSSTPVGPIVGGVVGALALIALLLFLFWCRRRRRATYVHSQPGFLEAEYTPVQMRTNGNASSTGNLSVNPFPFTEQPRAQYHDRAPLGKSIGPQELYAVGSSTPSHSHTTSLDTSDASGYLADNQLQPLRPMHKGEILTQPPVITSLVHQDSGVRLHAPQSNVLVDVPPLYTAN